MASPRVLPPAFAAMIASFRLELRGSKSVNTTRIYTDAATKLAWWLIDHGKATSWADVDKNAIREYMAWLRENGLSCHCGKTGTHADFKCPKGRPLKPGYTNNLYRSIQQFWKFYAEEEDTVSPMVGLTPPPVPEELVPVLTDEQRAAILKPIEKARDFEGRRDYALLRILICSGIRLEEVTDLEVNDVNLELLEVTVRGKGDIPRIVKIDVKTARAIDRYLRARAVHKYAEHRRLWLAVKNRGPLTDNGIRQIVERRGEQVGVKGLYPHLFRHDFTHRWLDAGGAEGDLMELNGWKSPQMLRRYGRSARSARARRAYDRVNIMGDL